MYGQPPKNRYLGIGKLVAPACGGFGTIRGQKLQAIAGHVDRNVGRSVKLILFMGLDRVAPKSLRIVASMALLPGAVGLVPGAPAGPLDGEAGVQAS